MHMLHEPSRVIVDCGAVVHVGVFQGQGFVRILYAHTGTGGNATVKKEWVG